MFKASSPALSGTPNLKRRTLIQALGVLNARTLGSTVCTTLSAGLAGTLALSARPARAALATSVIEGRERWLFPGWESTRNDALSDCLRVLDLIQAASAKLAARQIRCVVVVAPLKAAVCAQQLPPEAALSDAVAARYGALLDAARQRQVTMVDGVQALAPLKAGGDVYIRADYHWSAHTAEAVATQTAQAIQGLAPLSGSAGSGRKLGSWNEEYHYGDLAELLPPERKKAIGKDRFVVRNILSGQDLLGDAPPVVHIVGNSMVQPYLGFAQKLSNALDRPVGLNWAFGDVGPWKMLLDYLQSPVFHGHAPQTIVWQFNEGQFMFGPNASAAFDPASLQSEAAWLDSIGRALG
jgi:alginate O-acetyltransferase complex protein AlgJ